MRISPVETAIPILCAEIAAFCAKYHIVRMWLFGSALRDDLTPESDVDVLVGFDPAHIPGWFILALPMNWPKISVTRSISARRIR